MRVPPQHAQVFVIGDDRHLYDVEAKLEQAGGGLVAQVVKVQVLDAGAARFTASVVRPGNTWPCMLRGRERKTSMTMLDSGTVRASPFLVSARWAMRRVRSTRGGQSPL